MICEACGRPVGDGQCPCECDLCVWENTTRAAADAWGRGSTAEADTQPTGLDVQRVVTAENIPFSVVRWTGPGHVPPPIKHEGLPPT